MTLQRKEQAPERLVSGYSAFSPRLKTDRLFLQGEGMFRFTGAVDEAARFVEEHQLLDPALWTRFAGEFQETADDDLGWRCEFWGKLMRGGALTYAYTQNQRLYQTLEAALREMLPAQDGKGRFSSYSVDQEFQGWDLWGRKYVLLGMEHFYDICKDPDLKGEILAALGRHAGYIMERIGPAVQGKKDIRETSHYWEGLNSSSLLEPFVRLYNMTGDGRYLDFAGYIVEQGGILSANIFRLALEDRLDPWQYPVTKAYEMMSCFEGLLEYARAADQPQWAQAAVNFARRVMRSDITVIGSAGCTHELFDHSRLRQADPAFTGIMQETCVTVTWLKLCGQMLCYTGDPAFGDQIERSLYNALLGAVNTQQVPVEPLAPRGWLPFDSYSPLRSGRRGEKVGGRMVLSDGTVYGCCAAIGSAGTGMAALLSVLATPQGGAVNLYLPGEAAIGTPQGRLARLQIDTHYPQEEEVRITMDLPQPETFQLALRIPGWCQGARAFVNGQAQTVTEGWFCVERLWQAGDRLELVFPMPVEAMDSRRLCPEAADMPRYVSLTRGPVALARDEALGGPDLDQPLELGELRARAIDPQKAGLRALQGFDVETAAGPARFIDYASAGKDYKSRIAAWVPVK